MKRFLIALTAALAVTTTSVHAVWDGYARAVAYMRETIQSTGASMELSLLDREVEDCFGQPARVATMNILPPDDAGDDAEVERINGCWRSNGQQVVFVASVKNDPKPLFLVFPSSKFRWLEAN